MEPEAEETITPVVEGDSLPMDEPVAEARRGRGRPPKSGGESSGKPADKPRTDVLPKRASKAAIAAAGDIYAIGGTLASVAGFQAAGFTMQSQKDAAGSIIANHALANWPRLYSFLEATEKTTAIVPLVLGPVMAELYMRTANPQVETLCAGILSQVLDGAKVEVPNEDSPTGRSEVEVWPILLAERARIVGERAAYTAMEAERMQAEADAAAAHTGPRPADADTEAEPDHEPSRYARVFSEADGGFPSGE